MNVLMAGMQIAMALGMMWSPGGAPRQFAGVLVRRIDVAHRRIHVLVSDELVVGREPHEARDDDRPKGTRCRRCDGESRHGGSHDMSAHPEPMANEPMGDMDSHMHSEMGTGPTQAAKFAWDHRRFRRLTVSMRLAPHIRGTEPEINDHPRPGANAGQTIGPSGGG